MARYFLIVCTVLSVACRTFAQKEVEVRGHFTIDSVELGKPITYSLTARYPEKLMVLFPDTSYTFSPFEFQKKSISPTQTRNGISYDSVVYTFATFEVDSVQSLQLPVFVVHEKDCTELLAEKSSVFFKTAILLPDSVQLEKLPLKINTNYNPVAWLFNYPLASVVISVLLVLLIVLWMLFGKRIRKHFQIKRLNKAHKSFLEEFNSQLEKTVLGSKTAAEMALITWKKYLENLSTKPFTKLTTKEIHEAVGNDNLVLALKDVDRVIYAGINSEREPFEQLRKFSEDKYREKLEEIKNG
jgi:hypothetical protein